MNNVSNTLFIESKRTGELFIVRGQDIVGYASAEYSLVFSPRLSPDEMGQIVDDMLVMSGFKATRN